MSNPLLRPNDPRFQRPDIRDAAGQNRFAENVDRPETPCGDRQPFAAPSADDARPFVPQYLAQQRSRGELWLILGGVGWGAAVVGALSLAGMARLGWICPLLGTAPSAAAWLMAYEERKAARAGAIGPEYAGRILHAQWLGFTALVACCVVVVAMIYRQMAFLPDL